MAEQTRPRCATGKKYNKRKKECVDNPRSKSYSSRNTTVAAYQRNGKCRPKYRKKSMKGIDGEKVSMCKRVR